MTAEMINEKAIFNFARRIELREARMEYLKQACGRDHELLARVQTLLGAFEEQASFLETSPMDSIATAVSPVSERAGDTIGPYRLLQQIGEGGMGVVYRAEQREPVARQVAFKIVKPGMDTQQVIARFEAERQALALMDHPNIAKVFDAGTTRTGRPYFVMELVNGVPITQYCDQHRLDVRERLELFVLTCRAVQHAHQKGIIHRDIKPSNVLIAEYDDRAVAKVIDFGVAKAVLQRLGERTMFTDLGQVIGTIEYMSPEQADLNQLDIDTRTDIYSLGVLLYELLTGETPFDTQRLRAAAFDEMLQIIRDEDPPRPSQRLRISKSPPSIAVNRQFDPHKLSNLVRDELDWVVMKALEKERTRRYETANKLADDVVHFLNDEHVAARPQSFAYQSRKIMRRHKGVLFSLALIIVTVLAGSAASLRQAYRATRAERDANHRLIAEAIARRAAEDAELDAKRRLFDSYTAQAKASRLSGRPGQRTNAIAAIAKAVSLAESLDSGRGTRLELRDEAIGAMNLVDLVPTRSWVGIPTTNTTIAFSADHSRFAMENMEEKSFHVRLTDNPEINYAMIPSPHAWSSARFTPNNKVLVVFGSPAHVTVWEIATNKMLFRPSVSGHHLTIDISPNGRHLALGEQSGAVRVFDIETGELISEHKVAHGLVERVRFTPDGHRIAVSSSESSAIEVRDVSSGAVHHYFDKVNNLGIWSLAWDASGSWLAAGGWKEIGIWDLAHPDHEPLRLFGHESAVHDVQFHPKGGLLASCSWDGTVRLWEPATGLELLQLEEVFHHFSPDGRHMATRRGVELCVWDVLLPAGIRWLYAKHFPSRSVAIGMDGRLLATGFEDGVRLYDLHSHEHLITLPLNATHGLKFLPNDSALITSTPIGVHFWPVDATSDGSSCVVRLGPPRPVDPAFGTSSRMAVSENGETVVAQQGFQGRHAVLVKRAQSDRKVFHLRHPTMNDVALSPDGRWAATGSWIGRDAIVWDVATGEKSHVLSSNGNTTVAFSPDGRWVATNGGDAVKFWQVGSWKQRFSVPATSGIPSATCFTSDSTVAAIGRRGMGLLFFDLTSGRPLATLRTAHTERMSEAMFFTPGAERLIVCQLDAGVCEYDLQAIRQQLERLDLDWDEPWITDTDSPTMPHPLKVEVDLGIFSGK